MAILPTIISKGSSNSCKGRPCFWTFLKGRPCLSFYPLFEELGQVLHLTLSSAGAPVIPRLFFPSKSLFSVALRPDVGTNYTEYLYVIKIWGYTKNARSQRKIFHDLYFVQTFFRKSPCAGSKIF